jgi:hypothetical protein
MKLRNCVLGLFLIPCALSASTILSDNFNDGVIDTTLWGTSNPGSYSAVTEGNGVLTTTGRGILYTQSEITGAYTITGNVKLLNIGEIFTIALHTNLSSFGGYHELQGLLVHFNGTDFGETLTIAAYNWADGSTTQLASTSYTFTANTEYSFTLLDTGSSLSVYINDTLVTSCVYTYGVWGNNIAFYSREANSACSSEIDNIAIYSGVPEPATCAAMLGFGALGLAFFRRRRKA